MNVRAAIASTVIALVVLTTSTTANPLFVGIQAAILGAYNPDYHASLLGDLRSSRIDGGAGVGFSGGISLEYELGDRSPLSLLLRFNYEDRSVRIGGAGPSVLVLIPGDSVPFVSPTYYDAQVTYALANTDILLSLGGSRSPFSFAIGPSIGYALTATRQETIESDLAGNVRRIVGQQDDGRTITVAHGDIPNRTQLRYGVKAGMRLRGWLGRRFSLGASFWYDYGLSSVVKDEPWRSNALQFGLEGQWAISR